MKICNATTVQQFEQAKALFKIYAQQLDVDLCFQNFDKELAEIQLQYGPPTGILLLAMDQEEAIGCVGVRAWNRETAELKRMYLKPEARGNGNGRKLLEAALTCASDLGYDRIRLDTLPSMQAAIQLYVSSGFKEIEPYRENPVMGALYFEKLLP
ncbi:MAG: GNAT family N-acetyltransferase [Saprospiraceae bacterium]|nr:GNAT family N-acetyltransferase [Saprospiraceae bacterium]